MAKPQPPPDEGHQMVDQMRTIAKAMMQGTPHARALGLEVTAIDRARASGKVAYRPDLIGDPDTGVIAGGVVTAFLDNLCGVAVMAALDQPTSIATLDLRIDYMRPATPGQDLLAAAHCYKVTRTIAFVRATAYEASVEDPIATATAAFALSSDGGRKPGSNRRPPQ
jgi:uncharacterized protein (TIGR00369 family)